MARKKARHLALGLSGIACWLMACGSEAPPAAETETAAPVAKPSIEQADFQLAAAPYENPTQSKAGHWKAFERKLNRALQNRDRKALFALLDAEVLSSKGRGPAAFAQYWDSLAEPWAAFETDWQRPGAFDNKDESLFSIPYWILRPCPQSDCWRLRPQTVVFAQPDSSSAAVDTLEEAWPLEQLGAELPIQPWYRLERADSHFVFVGKGSLQSRKGTRQLAFERMDGKWRLFMWK